MALGADRASGFHPPDPLPIVVIGRHVERLEFLNIALGNKPALEDEESFYQRMLAGDSDEAVQQAWPLPSRT